VLNDYFVEQTTLDVPANATPIRCARGAFTKNARGFKVKARLRTILKILKRLQVSKAAGSDEIPAILLKKMAEHIAPAVTHIFQLSLKHGIFPSKWKIADVVPIHKKKSRSQASNYRPISLLAIISKAFETLVAIPFKKFLRRILHNHQFGFRSKHSTMHMLSVLTHGLAKNLSEGKEVRVVALDISKAFDKVWHDGLIFKLEAIGVPAPMLKWFASYLEGRQQRVLVGNSKSDLKPIQAGVPQGSVLGPLLFLVYINDLFLQVENNLDVFADDSTLWRESGPSDAEALAAAASLNRDLARIEAWAKKWLVTYNSTKTELVTFSRKRDNAFRQTGITKDGVYKPHPSAPTPPPLTFCGVQLQESPGLKLVGLHLSYNLCWTEHVRKTAAKARRALYVLRCTRPYLDNDILLRMYKTHVRSIMEYACPIWQGTAPKDVKARLDRVENEALRIIYGSVPESRPVQTLEHRRDVATLSVFHGIVRRNAPRATRVLCPARAQPLRRSKRTTSTRKQRQDYFAPVRVTSVTASYWTRSFALYAADKWNKRLDINTQSVKNLQRFKVLVNKVTLLTI
jgi:retron-type reverse transcriptase